MIGYLSGVLCSLQLPSMMTLLVAEVGYEIEVTQRWFAELPAVGMPLCVYTHLQIREDAHLLYGFETGEERQLFRTLLKVNGIGPKLALSILSASTQAGLIQAIANNDKEQLRRLPGIGRKTAERLLIELKDKLPDMPAQLFATTHPSVSKTASLRSDARDAVSALVSLGYKEIVAVKMVSKLDDGDKPTQQLLKEALQAAS